REQTEAAGNSMEQNGIAWLDGIGLPQQVLRCKSLQHGGGSYLKRDAIRQWYQFSLSDETSAGISAQMPGGISHPLAYSEVGNAVSKGFDNTCRFYAWYQGQGMGIQA